MSTSACTTRSATRRGRSTSGSRPRSASLRVLKTQAWKPRPEPSFNETPTEFPEFLSRVLQDEKLRSERKITRVYSTLLSIMFPPNELFIIGPETGSEDQKDRIDVTLFYEVYIDESPVFLVEYRSSERFHHPSFRQDADAQMRQRLWDLASESVLPKLYGLSIIGTKLCIYERDGLTGEELLQQPERTGPSRPDLAPMTFWRHDIRSPEGFSRFRAICERTKVLIVELIHFNNQERGDGGT